MCTYSSNSNMLSISTEDCSQIRPFLRKQGAGHNSADPKEYIGEQSLIPRLGYKCSNKCFVHLVA